MDESYVRRHPETDEARVERLRLLLGEMDVWEEPSPSALQTSPELPAVSPAHTEPLGRGQATTVHRIPVLEDSDTENELTRKNLVGRPAQGDGRKKTKRDVRGKRQVVGGYKPKVSLEELKQLAFSNPQLEAGEMAVKSETFSPWRLVKRYAEMYVGKANGPIVGPYFDEEALLKKQEWDFFYIWPPEGAGSSPLLFVPSRQLKFLLRTINAAHQLSLNIPGGPTSAKFCIEFGMFGTPRPRYLGRARDAAELFKLQDTMPLPDNKELLDVTGMALMEYTELLRATRVSIMAAPKQKKKSHKVRRVVTRKAWGRAAKRVQRYLGLREKLSTGSSLSTSLVRLDVHSPAPFKAEDFVVFICFDVETYEKNHNIVTEIGFAILDTMDLVGIPPGENGEHWSKLIQARHLRIKEYSWVVNMEYIKGCPDNFDFGQSEFVPLKGVREVIQKIFTNDTSLVQEEPDDPENRRIVLVGHDIKQDIAHLQKLDVDVYALPNLLDVVDNQSLQQHLRAMRNPQKLESVLTDFGILSRHLHNAGNDAVYTLQSLLALAIRKSKQKVVEGDAKNKERAKHGTDSDEGWSTGGEESDGGAPTWRMDSRSHT